jgi:hypothetical protein
MRLNPKEVKKGLFDHGFSAEETREIKKEDLSPF